MTSKADVWSWWILQVSCVSAIILRWWWDICRLFLSRLNRQKGVKLQCRAKHWAAVKYCTVQCSKVVYSTLLQWKKWYTINYSVKLVMSSEKQGTLQRCWCAVQWCAVNKKPWVRLALLRVCLGQIKWLLLTGGFTETVQKQANIPLLTFHLFFD